MRTTIGVVMGEALGARADERAAAGSAGVSSVSSDSSSDPPPRPGV